MGSGNVAQVVSLGSKHLQPSEPFHQPGFSLSKPSGTEDASGWWWGLFDSRCLVLYLTKSLTLRKARETLCAWHILFEPRFLGSTNI